MAVVMSVKDKIKIELRENVAPYFGDDEIDYYLSKNNNDFDDTLYEMLIVKSEDSTISVSGLNTQDTSSYFKRLASRYKKPNSGVLKGL